MRRMKGRRTSNLELFRIFCMVGITLQHMMMHTGALESSNLYVRIWAQFFNIFAKAGVNGFVMISAWFLGTKRFSYKKIFDLYKTIWWYSISLGILGILADSNLISKNRLLATVFPVTFSHWWFVTAFIGMLAFIPSLNLIIGKCSEKQYLNLVLTMLILFSIIPTCTAQTPYLNNMTWFCCLYLLVNFVKKYEMKYRVFSVLSKNITWIFMFILIFLSTVFFTILEKQIPSVREGTNFFTGMYIITEVIASLSVFLCFKNYKLGYVKWINWGGAHTFPVYLIQSNVFFTVILWNFVSGLELDKSIFFPFFVMILTLLIVAGFMVCSILLDSAKTIAKKIFPVIWINSQLDRLCELLDKTFIETESMQGDNHI